MSRLVILDGYLDEPSCLGVPPYIAPHVRYTYGAAKEAGVSPAEIDYLTIDQLREQEENKLGILKQAELVVIIAGTTVPGKYLGGKPVTIKEIEEIARQLDQPKVFLSGPIINCGLEVEQIDTWATEVPGEALYQQLTGKKPTANSPVSQIINRWAKQGAEVTEQHPNFPYLVCEIETFRGCPRENNCSFCSEGFKQVTYHREIAGVIEEVAALQEAGNRYFRLGAQTDLLLYQAHKEGDQLIPNPEAIEQLYTGIREAAPKLKTLHMDNINPATIADHPERAKAMLATIAEHNTAGDIAAFGLESADPQVLKTNNIGTTVEKTYQAVKLVNEVAGFRDKGVPKLLPGLNFLHGLQGERKETRELNLEFLRRLLADDLLVRRINIRQVTVFGNYSKDEPYSNYEFKQYKQQVNEEINQPMLKKVFPTGTLLEDVIVEEVRGTTSFGRQLGTYPILVGIPGKYEVGEHLDVKIIDHGYRSITGIPHPFKINHASIDQLEALPGIGKNRATKLFMAGEIDSLEELSDMLAGYDVTRLENLITFE